MVAHKLQTDKIVSINGDSPGIKEYKKTLIINAVPNVAEKISNNDVKSNLILTNSSLAPLLFHLKIPYIPCSTNMT